MDFEIIEAEEGLEIMTEPQFIEERNLIANFDTLQSGESKLLHSPIRKLSKFYEKAKMGNVKS